MSELIKYKCQICNNKSVNRLIIDRCCPGLKDEMIKLNYKSINDLQEEIARLESGFKEIIEYSDVDNDGLTQFEYGFVEIARKYLGGE